MKSHRRMFHVLVFSGILLISFGGFLGKSALTQEKFPIRAVSVVVPWAAGGAGTVDVQALRPHFEKTLGVGLVDIYKTGGGGTIAWNYLANAAPDGYTVGIINPSTIVTVYTTKTGVNYDKFDAIILSVILPAGLVVRANSPWKTFKEFIDYAKANPEKVQVSNSGHGAMFHIGAVGIEMATGAKFTHVPFKGSLPGLTALLGGHVDATVIQISTVLPHLKAKKLKVLAVCSPKRMGILPDAPRFSEYGFDMDISTWYVYGVPKGTPKDRVRILHDGFKAGVDSKMYKDFYDDQGGVVEYIEPKRLETFLNNQHKLWKKIIDFGGFKAEG